MGAVLDMNSHRIINLAAPTSGADAARLTDVLAVSPGTGINTFLTTPTSANLAAAVTDETGTGALVFGTNPTITGGTITGIIDLAIADGGTGASTAAGARTNLGITIGTDVQAFDADLSALAAETGTGLWARTGAGTGDTRTLTGTADQIGVTDGDGVSGNPVLALLGNALALAGLTGAADKLAYFTGSAAMAVTNLVSQARSFLADPSAAYVNFLQSGASGAAETVQTTLRRVVVCPEQFTGTDTEIVNAAFQAAGDVPGGQLVARIVRFSRVYDTTSTIDVPAYVSIEGVGMGRCGLRPTMSSGPALRANPANNSSSYLCEWRDFSIDGTNATGSAYALELTTQKVTTMTRIKFNDFDTTSHAVKVLLGCQSVIFDQCHFLANRLHQRIGVPYVGTSYPTTITHRGCIYEDGLITGAEAIIIEDSSGCMWDQKCVLQGNLQPVLFRITSSASEQAIAEHQWLGPWIEGNGSGTSYTWRFEGDAAKPLTNCVIQRAAIHGAAPTAHVYALNTDRLSTQDNHVPAGHTWLSDAGGNTRYNYAHAALYQLNTATFADVDGTNHRTWAPDGDVVAYWGATENLHRNATHRFGNQALSVDYGIFGPAGLNLGAGLALQVGGTQIVGAQGAAVADATDAASAITQLNALLARCRAHGLIAT